MKQLGSIILIIGILITAFAGFNFITKKKVVEIGKLEITKDQNNVLDWSPMVGVVVMVVGAGVYFFGIKKK